MEVRIRGGVRECGGYSTGSCQLMFLLQLYPASSRGRRHKVSKCTPSMLQREGKLCKTVPSRDTIHPWKACAWKTVYRCSSAELGASCVSAKGGWVEKQLREVVAACFICPGSPKGAKLCTSQLPKHTIWEKAHFSFQHVKGNHITYGGKEPPHICWCQAGAALPAVAPLLAATPASPAPRDVPGVTKWEQVVQGRSGSSGTGGQGVSSPGLLSRRGSTSL